MTLKILVIETKMDENPFSLSKAAKAWLALASDEEVEALSIDPLDANFANHLIYASLHDYKIVALGTEAAIATANAGVANYFKLPAGLDRFKEWLRKD